MTNTIDTAAIESLRSFAVDYGELLFGHMCTAALNGEGWAVERVTPVLHTIRAGITDHDEFLDVIRATDTTRPDGAIARKIEV